MGTKAVWVAGVLVLALLGYSACEGVRADRAEAARDSALAVSQIKDSVAQLRANVADSLIRASQSTSRTAYVTRWKAETVWASLTPISTESDSLEAAKVVIHLLRESLDSLTVAFQAQQQATAHLQAAYQGERERADGLEGALRKMPGCRRLLGVPMPRPVLGYGITQQGLGLFAGIAVPLGKC